MRIIIFVLSALSFSPSQASDEFIALKGMSEVGIEIPEIENTCGLDKDFFTPWIEKGNSLLRSIHYPPVDGNTNPHRARAHTDINLITLLIGAEEGGLEVLNKDGSWIKVEPSSNAIVCNIGDLSLIHI